MKPRSKMNIQHIRESLPRPRANWLKMGSLFFEMGSQLQQKVYVDCIFCIAAASPHTTLSLAKTRHDRAGMCRRAAVIDKRSALPLRPLGAMCVMEFAHFYSITSLSAYAGYLSVDCGWAQRVESAGFVTGSLSASLVVGRLCTNVLWGVAGDRYGRKPALLFSMACLTLGNLSFGLATNLVCALLVRFILLSVNGI